MDLQTIRAKVKSLVGDSGYDDDALNLIINRIYQHALPIEFSLEALKSEFSVTTAEGVGEYAVDPNLYLTITQPVFLNGAPASFYVDKATFASKHAIERVHPITAADTVANTLGIAGSYASHFGIGRTFRVGSSTGNDGNYIVTAVSYALEVTTITVASVVDATADGELVIQDRGQPLDVLYWAQYLSFRPVPDSNYGANYIFIADTIRVPTALTLITDEPVEIQWGMVIAYDAAIEILGNNIREEELKLLNGFRMYFAGLIAAKETKKYLGLRAKGSF